MSGWYWHLPQMALALRSWLILQLLLLPHLWCLIVTEVENLRGGFTAGRAGTETHWISLIIPLAHTLRFTLSHTLCFNHLTLLVPPEVW